MKTANIASIAGLALAFALIGCSKQDAPAKQSAASTAAKPAQPYEAVAEQGKGFTVGAMMSAHPVYVLFDPQCPHCGHLWESSLPLHSKAKFVWIPVSIVGSKSAQQGAALLAASNPAETMSAHEKSILAGTGGMAAPANVPPELAQAVQKNTTLFSSLGVESVPYILAKNVSTGATVTHTGSLSTAELAKFLGFAAP